MYESCTRYEQRVPVICICIFALAFKHETYPAVIQYSTTYSSCTPHHDYFSLETLDSTSILGTTPQQASTQLVGRDPPRSRPSAMSTQNILTAAAWRTVSFVPQRHSLLEPHSRFGDKLTLNSQVICSQNGSAVLLIKGCKIRRNQIYPWTITKKTRN